MPVFVAAGAAAAYSYYKKRSSHLSDEEGGEQGGAEGDGRSSSISCKATANNDKKAHADAVAEIPENGLSQVGGGDNTSSNEAAGRGGKEIGRPAPLLEKWKEKYGAAGGRNRSGASGANNSDRKNKDVEDADGRVREFPSPHLTSVSGSESSVVGNDGAIAIGMNGSDAAASAKNEKAENVPTGASNATLLQSWNERYPHHSKSSKRQRQKRFDGPAGKMVRSFLAKRSASKSNDGCTELSTKEEENKCDLSQSDRKNQMDNDSDRADNALYKEVATAVFGELNNQ